jgi:hypothetical protein
MPEPGPGRLERSCGFSPRDYIRVAPWRPGLERIEGFFAGHAYDPHRHDTYAIGYTLAGVQSFNYRGARANSLPGETMILHPDETHDGRSGSDNAFRYRMIYVEPSLVQAALGGRMRALPFAREVVRRDGRLLAALRGVLDDLDAGIDDLQADGFLAELADILCAHDRSAAPRPFRPGAPVPRHARHQPLSLSDHAAAGQCQRPDPLRRGARGSRHGGRLCRPKPYDAPVQAGLWAASWRVARSPGARRA